MRPATANARLPIRISLLGRQKARSQLAGGRLSAEPNVNRGCRETPPFLTRQGARVRARLVRRDCQGARGLVRQQRGGTTGACDDHCHCRPFLKKKGRD